MKNMKKEDFQILSLKAEKLINSRNFLKSFVKKINIGPFNI